MSSSQNVLNLKRVYQPAVLKHIESLGWVIEFSILDTRTEKLKRQRVKLNVMRKHCSTLAEFKIQANAELMCINNRLNMLHIGMQNQISLSGQAYLAQPTGYNLKPTETKSELVTKALSLYIYNVSGNLRRTTLVSYKTFVKQFSDWCKRHHPTLTVEELDRKIAVQYLDFVADGGNNGGTAISPRTYNNNLKFLRIFGNWCKERSLVDENVFESMKTRRELPKQRTVIPMEVRKKITTYLEERNKPFLLICHLVYSSLLRPVEISRIQVSQVDIANCCIHMPATKTKTYYAKDARLTEATIALMSEHIKGAKPSDYLFADKNWRCGATPMSSHTYGNVWAEIRKELHLPKEMQLYSLRDSGIYDMLKSGVDSLSVMQAADHHNLSITTKYANHTDKELIEKLNNRAPDF